MKYIFFLITLILINGLFAQEFSFEPGQEVYTYGDRTKLRAGADVGSEVLTLLPIGSSVEVLMALEETYPYNGFETPWYKVRFKGQEGYIVGGLLTKVRLEHAGQVFLVSAKQSEGEFSLLIRALKESGGYLETAFTGDYYPGQYRTYDVSDGKGLAGVKNILHVHRYGESCGDGGGYQVLFFDGQALFHVMTVSNFADIGSSEETLLIFPSQHDKGSDVVLMEVESREEEVTEDFDIVADGEVTICTRTRFLRWNGKELLGNKP